MSIARKQIIAMVALAAAACVLNVEAADRASSTRDQGEAPYQSTQQQWLDAERNVEAGNAAPIPSAVPTPSRSAADFSRETAHQAAETRWFELERARGSGNVAPVPFPPPGLSAADYR